MLVALCIWAIADYGKIGFLQGFFGKTEGWKVMDLILNWIFILAAPIYLIIFFCCICKNLEIAGNIIEAGSDCFGDLPSAIFVPIISLVGMVLNVWLWVFIMMSIISKSITGKSANTFLPAVSMTSADQWWVAYAFVNLIYWICFWSNVGTYILCSMFTDW